MKVRASVKKYCSECKIIKRNNVVRVICDKRQKNQTTPRLIISLLQIYKINKLNIIK